MTNRINKGIEMSDSASLPSLDLPMVRWADAVKAARASAPAAALAEPAAFEAAHPNEPLARRETGEYFYDSTRNKWYGWQAARALQPVPVFRVSVNSMLASNGVTYVVCLDRGDRPHDAPPWAPGRITPINRNDVEEANDEGERWAEFLGVPFTPCVPKDGPLPNTVPEYGDSNASPTCPIAQPVPEPELRRAVRTAWLTGVPNFREFYDAEIFKALGIAHFQDLYKE